MRRHVDVEHDTDVPVEGRLRGTASGWMFVVSGMVERPGRHLRTVSYERRKIGDASHVVAKLAAAPPPSAVELLPSL
jgi:hypothetical protein